MPTLSVTSDETDPNAIPNSWWMGGLIAGSLLTMVVAQTAFAIPWYLTLVAIALSSVLAAVAVRSTGETDINPVGGMGKVTQLVFGGIAPGQPSINLMSAAITGAGASQAADLKQDFKTGSLLGASPKKQFLAQMAGICTGVVLAVPAYLVFSKAYTIGDDQLPAPAAQAWRAMAELLTEGLSALPPHSGKAVALAAGAGILLASARKIEGIRAYVPSGLAMGIAFIIRPYDSLVIFYGLIIWWIWRRIDAPGVERLSFAAAAGLIAGQGVMGVVNAVLTLAGIGGHAS